MQITCNVTTCKWHEDGKCIIPDTVVKRQTDDGDECPFYKEKE